MSEFNIGERKNKLIVRCTYNLQMSHFCHFFKDFQ